MDSSSSSSGIGGMGSSGSGRTTPDDITSDKLANDKKNKKKANAKKSSPLVETGIVTDANVVRNVGASDKTLETCPEVAATNKKKNKKAKNKANKLLELADAVESVLNAKVAAAAASKKVVATATPKKTVATPKKTVVKEKKRRASSCSLANSSSCPCCGEMFLDDSDFEGVVEVTYYSGSEGDSSCTSEDEETLIAKSRMNTLLMQNAQSKVLIQKNSYYNRVLTTQKIVREQQLMVLQRTNTLNASFVRNMEAIIQLGYCPMGLQHRSDSLSQGILDVHKMIQKWDERLEVLIPVPKSKKTKNEGCVNLLPSLLDVFRTKYGMDIGGMTDLEFELALKDSLEEMPDIMPDEATIRAALHDMDLKAVELEWDKFECKAETNLRILEIQLIEICVEFGIRVRLPKVPGYEWAHAVRRSQDANYPGTCAEIRVDGTKNVM